MSRSDSSREKGRISADVALAVCPLASSFAGIAPSPVALVAANLLANLGFKQNAAGWALCSTAGLQTAEDPGVTPAMVYAGGRALRPTYSDTNTCGRPVFHPHGAASQGVDIPVDAQDSLVAHRAHRRNLATGDRCSRSGLAPTVEGRLPARVHLPREKAGR